MKKLYTSIILLIALFVACSKDEIEFTESTHPVKLYASICNEVSRVQLNNRLQTVWNTNDCISVFYHSTGNACWQFDGNTGDTEGSFSKISDATGEYLPQTYAIYPYSDRNVISAEQLITQIPATQTYHPDSYAIGENLMIAVSDNNVLKFKNFFGWIKIQITGTEKITKLTLKGNQNEKLAGIIKVDPNTLNYSFLGNADTEIIINFKNPLSLFEEPTAFYFAIPPQEFKKGITVEIEMLSDFNHKMIQSTSKTVLVKRNHIVPMAPVVFDKNKATTPDNEIWYRSQNGQVISTSFFSNFDAKILSNTYENEYGIIIFDKAITKIATAAFSHTPLTSIAFGQSVVSIEQQALQYTQLKEINIPDNVRTIKNDAFKNSNLQKITFGTGINTIEERAFQGCKLTNLTIPNHIKTIGASAFSGCNLLQTVTTGASIIGEYAFENCSELKEVFLTDNTIEIKNYAFSGCQILSKINIPYSISSIGDSAFENCQSLREINIPYSVTFLGSYVFSGCCNLSNAVLPNSLKCLNVGLFEGCAQLKSIKIPDSVISVAHNVFSGCDNLTNIITGSNLSSIPGLAGDCHNLKSFSGPLASEDNRCLIKDGNLLAFAPSELTEYTIPNNVTVISEKALSKCTLLNQVHFPVHLTSIGISAFEGCNGLTELNLPSNLTTIEKYAFKDCGGLTKINLSESLVKIEYSAFSGCSRLPEITLPENLNSLNGEVFRDCYELTKIYIRSRNLKINGYNILKNCLRITDMYFYTTIPPKMREDVPDNPWSPPKNTTFHVPTGYAELYKKTYYLVDDYYNLSEDISI